MRSKLLTPADAVYQQAGERVVFRFRPPWAVPFAELRGDLVHWQEALELQPGREGWWEACTQVPPGTFSYKFLVGGSSWHLDPYNPRTRTVQGIQNSVLVVGGADEPVLHAPAPPYLHLKDNGSVCVRAGLRSSSSNELTLCWDEGHGWRYSSMTVVGEEDEHVLLEACVPASARQLEYLFRLSEGRVVGQAGGPGLAFRIDTASLRTGTPSWWKDAVLYTIWVDRFRRGGCDGFWTQEQQALCDGTSAGGDLPGIVEALPHLLDLGVNALHLTPIVVARSSHRYDAIDLRSVDPALGGEQALQLLLDEALAVGMRVLLDLSLTHVHRDFFAFRDVRERGESSRYWEWFYARQHPFHEGLIPGYLHYRKGAWEEPLLRLDNPEVEDYLVGTVEHWARLGVDGFRIDAAADIPRDLLRRISKSIRAIRPEAAIFGEVVTENIHRWNGGIVDSATDFPAQETLYDWLWRKRVGAREAASRWARRRFQRGGPGWSALGFVGTQDQHRFRSLTGDARATRLALLLVLLRAEIPALYYGDEAGLFSTGAQRNFEDNWPDRQCMPWDRSKWDHDTLALVREALRLRASQVALRRGDDQYMVFDSESAEDTLLLRRTWGEEVVDVLVHAGEGTRTISMPAGAPSSARVLLSLGVVSLEPSEGSATLGPWSALVAERVASPEATEAWKQILRDNRRAGAEAFRQGALEWIGLPTHLYVTVTEACNLRCRHCINHSPERTQRGTAREIQPWLLDRLREAFSAARYFGFTHGGESLVSPLFPALLRAIQKARKPDSGSYQAHLLTNGMLLTGDTTRSLIDLGVTSIGLSIDGARAETSERLRVGSSFQTVLRNLRQALRVRSTTGADLRIGISMVVGASNLAELSEMGNLALDLGVDWLKLEEVFPSTPVARSEYLDPKDSRLVEALTALRESLAGTKLVLVDHLAPPTGCACEGKEREELRVFREADNFANRACFQPCRAAWEQACVDPDGSLHPIDYHHPAVGNVYDEPLLELWHNAAMRSLRSNHIGRVAPGLRSNCPIDEQLGEVPQHE